MKLLIDLALVHLTMPTKDSSNSSGEARSNAPRCLQPRYSGCGGDLSSLPAGRQTEGIQRKPRKLNMDVYSMRMASRPPAHQVEPRQVMRASSGLSEILLDQPRLIHVGVTIRVA